MHRRWTARPEPGIKHDKQINTDLYYLIRFNRNIRFTESVDRIIVSSQDVEKNGEIWLEVWCSSVFSFLMGKHRYNVFFVKTKPNPNWSCFDDLGTGLK